MKQVNFSRGQAFYEGGKCTKVSVLSGGGADIRELLLLKRVNGLDFIV